MTVNITCIKCGGRLDITDYVANHDGMSHAMFEPCGCCINDAKSVTITSEQFDKVWDKIMVYGMYDSNSKSDFKKELGFKGGDRVLTNEGKDE